MRISVLLPFKNEAPFLRECLDSLARQTRQDFELVAVDDGSMDDSCEIVSAYEGRLPRLKLLHTGGAGLVPALNLGLARASGELVARADGDDIYHPRRLELQAALMDRGVDLAGSLVRFFPRPALMGGFHVYEGWVNRLRTHTAMASEMYVETPISHPSLMFRRSLLHRIGGYGDRDWPEDFDLMLRAFQQGAVFGKVPRVLHFWREHEGRLCRKDKRYDLDAFIRCRCHYLARGPLADGRRILLWGAGPIGKKTASHLLAEGVDFEAFVDIDPRKIGGRIRERRVHLPHILKKDRFFVLSCVGKRNARYLVKEELEAMGYRERLDYILAA